MPRKKPSPFTPLDDDDESNEDENSVAILIEQARNELGKGRAKTAKSYLDQALKIDDEEPLVLIERGRCLVQLSQPTQALKDVDPVLKDNPSSPLALSVKADAMYHLGDFEHALLYYHRALRYSTQDTEGLRLGIRRSVKAINNAIGKQMSNYYTGLKSVLVDLEKNVLETSLSQLSTVVIQPQESNKQPGSRKAFLGQLYAEVEYLSNLQLGAKGAGLSKKKGSSSGDNKPLFINK
ncbi:tetratricopeptide repeat protein 25 isoform X2 [Eurytemora carolleeae]|uniref:tetratricopeptide repeat protein 25 isoform X2 n=1 Tax=Eurytemora carolleeae TaxID=1294199 RepID=UPI000C789718|nr:tetratricopeptide repeat protein 25 isoform X2 [Eurytemora carolleeae]|eukprot:XP_023345648.1 tetratricopeptide repeat protein 25-like isoform X2 [Eurytemora affinis]